MKRIYDKNQEMQEVEICTEKFASPEQVYFHFAFLCCCLCHNKLDLYKQKGWIDKYFCVWRKQLVRILGFLIQKQLWF